MARQTNRVGIAPGSAAHRKNDRTKVFRPNVDWPKVGWPKVDWQARGGAQGCLSTTRNIPAAELPRAHGRIDAAAISPRSPASTLRRPGPTGPGLLLVYGACLSFGPALPGPDEFPLVLGRSCFAPRHLRSPRVYGACVARPLRVAPHRFRSCVAPRLRSLPRVYGACVARPWSCVALTRASSGGG